MIIRNLLRAIQDNIHMRFKLRVYTHAVENFYNINMENPDYWINCYNAGRSIIFCFSYGIYISPITKL